MIENINNQVSYLSFPIYVWWDITNKCNFNCLHCYSRSGPNNDSSDELTIDEIKKIILDLSKNGIFFIYFLGGEPFIRHDFMEIITFARKCNIGIMVNTNGWFITENIAERLKAIEIGNVRVSLDGATQNTHDYFRKKTGAFSRAVSALKNLKAARINKISAVATITKYNISEINELIDLAFSMGVNDIQCVPLSNCGRGFDNYIDFGLEIEDTISLRKALDQKKKQYNGRMVVYAVDGVLDNPCTICVKEGKVRPDFMGCRAGRTACNIDYNGNIIPCLIVREPIAGNVRDQSFKEIWDNSAIFRAWRQKHMEYEECKNCEWNDICVRECPASPSQKDVIGQTRIDAIRKIKKKWGEKNNCNLGVIGVL